MKEELKSTLTPETRLRKEDKFVKGTGRYGTDDVFPITLSIWSHWKKKNTILKSLMSQII